MSMFENMLTGALTTISSVVGESATLNSTTPITVFVSRMSEEHDYSSNFTVKLTKCEAIINTSSTITINIGDTITLDSVDWSVIEIKDYIPDKYTKAILSRGENQNIGGDNVWSPIL